MKEFVILVDENDTAWGKMEKQEAHELGLMHRAFSVFIFNSKNELLLQQRAEGKYHSPGVWTNTCCSHPRFGEDTGEAAKRRLMEEMGIDSEIFPVFSFIYEAQFSNGLSENEFDHVLFGFSDEKPRPLASEVKDFKYMDLEKLAVELDKFPDKYSEWLKACFSQVQNNLLSHLTTINSR